MKTFADTLYDKTALAERLNCSPGHLDNLDAREVLPRPIRLGRLKRWDSREIELWIATGCPLRAEWESMREEGARLDLRLLKLTEHREKQLPNNPTNRPEVDPDD